MHIALCASLLAACKTCTLNSHIMVVMSTNNAYTKDILLLKCIPRNACKGIGYKRARHGNVDLFHCETIIAYTFGNISAIHTVRMLHDGNMLSICMECVKYRPHRIYIF